MPVAVLGAGATSVNKTQGNAMVQVGGLIHVTCVLGPPGIFL